MPLSSRKFLQYSQVLELFPLQQRNRIYAVAEYKDFRSDTPVFKKGEDGSFMAGVMSGRLRMSVHSKEGKEMLVTMVEKGELFGEMSVLDESPRAVDVISETDCTLMIIKRDDFIPILRESPDAMMGLLKLTCHRMRLYLQTMELVSLQSLPVRFARYLLRLARDYGTERDGHIVISARLSQLDIAQQLACTRESINKQLSSFADKKLLALEGDDIVLLDVAGIRQAIAMPGG